MTLRSRQISWAARSDRFPPKSGCFRTEKGRSMCSLPPRVRPDGTLPPLRDIHVRFETEDVCRVSPRGRCDDGEVRHVDAEPGGYAGRRRTSGPPPPSSVNRGLREGVGQRLGILRGPVRNGSLLLPPFRERKGLFEVLIQLRSGIPDDLQKPSENGRGCSRSGSP